MFITALAVSRSGHTAEMHACNLELHRSSVLHPGVNTCVATISSSRRSLFGALGMRVQRDRAAWRGERMVQPPSAGHICPRACTVSLLRVRQARPRARRTRMRSCVLTGCSHPRRGDQV